MRGRAGKEGKGREGMIEKSRGRRTEKGAWERKGHQGKWKEPLGEGMRDEGKGKERKGREGHE